MQSEATVLEPVGALRRGGGLAFSRPKDSALQNSTEYGKRDQIAYELVQGALVRADLPSSHPSVPFRLKACMSPLKLTRVELNCSSIDHQHCHMQRKFP